MIIDLILIGLSTVGVIGMHGGFTLSRDERPSIPKLEEPENEVVTLVLELLNEGTGWTKEHDRTVAGTIVSYTHVQGIVLSSYNYKNNNIFLYVNDDNGIPGFIDTTKTNQKRLCDAIQKFDARAKTARQDELARALANRIVSGTTVPALLGDSSGTGTSEVANVDDQRITSDTVSANYVTYCPTSEKIVRDCVTGSEEIFLSTALAKRYNLKSGCMPKKEIR